VVSSRSPGELRTERLILRRWRDGDREPFARMNADPEVMRHMIRPLTRGESDAFVDRIERHFEERGYGLWAVEVPGEAPFIGYVGLQVPTFMPSPEIGWRLDTPFWGRGYATEAARAALRDAFDRAGVPEVISFTTPFNVKSIAVMERLGMTHDPADDFEHPNVPDGHPMKHHVLYRISSNTGRLRADPAGSSRMSRAPSSPRITPPRRKRRT
jgi:RimJ/RimL family protein N-acetyltransferase